VDDEQTSEAVREDLIGACVDAASVTDRLGVAPEEVDHFTRVGYLLTLTTEEGVLYPLFQFTDMDWTLMGLHV